MEERLDDFFLMFQAKGFTPIEIPGLMKDVFNIFNNPICLTIAEIEGKSRLARLWL